MLIIVNQHFCPTFTLIFQNKLLKAECVNLKFRTICVVFVLSKILNAVTEDPNTNLKNRTLPFNYSLRTKHYIRTVEFRNVEDLLTQRSRR